MYYATHSSKSLLFLLLILIAAMFSSSFSSAQPNLEWDSYYPPGSNRIDAQVIADYAGNVYVGGTKIDSLGHTNWLILKYDLNGDLVWSETYYGGVNGANYINAIALDEDANVIVAGSVATSSNGDDYEIRKYDSSGDLVWAKTQNGTASDDDHVLSITCDRSSNVYVTGESEGTSAGYDILTIKYNSGGTKLWSVRKNGSSDDADAGRMVKVDTAGNVYVVGFTTNTSAQRDATTIKYNSAGTQQWLKKYNGSADLVDEGNSIALDSLGNVYVTGLTYASSTNINFVTIKYNSSGTQQWASTYNGPAGGDDQGKSVAVAKNLSVYVSGSSEGSTSNLDLATIRYNSDGSVNWTERYDGPAGSTDMATQLCIDVAGDIVVTSGSIGTSSDMDYLTLCFADDGTLNWDERYDGVASLYDQTSSMYIDDMANIYLGGMVTNEWDQDWYAILKYNQADKNNLQIEKYLGFLAIGLTDVSQVDTVKNIVNAYARRCVDDYWHIYFSELFEAGLDSGIDIKARMNETLEDLYHLAAGKDHVGKIISALNYRGFTLQPNIIVPNFHLTDSANKEMDDAKIGYAHTEEDYPAPCVNCSGPTITRGNDVVAYWIVLGNPLPFFQDRRTPNVLPVTILNCTAKSYGEEYLECEVCSPASLGGVEQNLGQGTGNQEISIEIGYNGLTSNDDCFNVEDANFVDDLESLGSYAKLSKLSGSNYYDWKNFGSDYAIRKLIHPILDRDYYGIDNPKYGDVLTLCDNTNNFNNWEDEGERFVLGQGGLYKIERLGSQQYSTLQAPLYFAFPYARTMWWIDGPDMTVYYGCNVGYNPCSDKREITEDNEMHFCLFCTTGSSTLGFPSNDITDWLASTDYTFMANYWLDNAISIGFGHDYSHLAYMFEEDFLASNSPLGCTIDAGWVHVVSATLYEDAEGKWYEVEKHFPNDVFYDQDVLHVRVRAKFKNNESIDECRDITFNNQDPNFGYSFLVAQIRGDIEDYVQGVVNYKIDVYK